MQTTITQAIRQRHGLPTDAPVGLCRMAAQIRADRRDEHMFSAIISSSAVDREDEVLLPHGMIATEFERAGTIFWNHDYDEPIGFAGVLRRTEAGIEAVGNTFMRRPGDYEGPFLPDFARAFVTQAQAAGKQAGVSVGFLPIESRPATKADRERFGMNVRRVHAKWKLLEFSIAPLQANPQAVVTAIGKRLSADAWRKLFPAIDVDAALAAAPMPPPDRSPKRYVIEVALPTPPIARHALHTAVQVELARHRGALFV